jgi:hypothetical protein
MAYSEVIVIKHLVLDHFEWETYQTNMPLCGLYFPALPKKKKVVVLERGPLSLVITTEELLDRKVAAPVYKPRIRL